MAKIDVLTNRYTSARAGANTAETVLNQTNVNVNGFGKIFSRNVDGQIYAQPLIVSDVQFDGGTTRSLVIVAASRNMAYAFDAEDPSQCHPVWRMQLDREGATPVLQVEGTATFSCNRFTIVGGGHDIWDPSDGFHFVYQPVQSGNVMITARVVSIQNTSDWAKAGVMIRETLDADSPHAMMVITPGQGAAFQFRPAKGAASVNVTFGTHVSAPFWVRLARTVSGNSFQFTASVSRDGINWTVVGSANIAMAASALAGMPVTAHPDGHGNTNPLLQDLCVAVIDRVILSS